MSFSRRDRSNRRLLVTVVVVLGIIAAARQQVAVCGFVVPPSVVNVVVTASRRGGGSAPCVHGTTVGSATTKLFSASSSTVANTDDGAAAADSGLMKTVARAGLGDPLRLGDIATVKYRCYVPGSESESDDSDNGSAAATAPFSRSDRQKVTVGDGSFIPGWDKALRGMRVGERSVVRITDPALAYGTAGVPPVIPPSAIVELDLEVLEATSAAAAAASAGNIDFDGLATADDTPRTAAEIAAAFEARQAARALEPEKEGLDAFLDKVKNFYFFGFFEGETGERPPWFLRPSITFPLAFAIVGFAFYVSYVSGAITERGAQVTDELDEIVLSSAFTTTSTTAVASLAFALLDGAVDGVPFS